MAEKGYILKVFAHASFGKMKTAIDACHERCGKSKIKIFFDMLYCAKKYGAGYYDYQVFGFYDLNREQRKTYITRLISIKLINAMNDPKYIDYLENKDDFYEHYREFIGRDFMRLKGATKEDVQKFVENKEYVFCKLQAEECGIGCEKLKPSDFESIDAFYNYLLEKKFCTIEDNIVQHPALSKLYPNAVNTIRVITIIGDDKKPHLLQMSQKMGKGGHFTDNSSLYSPIDINTGKLMYVGHSGNSIEGVIYEKHPDTGITIAGYEIPFYKEAAELCLKAAMVFPQVRYVGWDVAITENGPVIIEGNTYTGNDFWQLPPHTPDKIGKLPTIMKYVPSFKY